MKTRHIMVAVGILCLPAGCLAAQAIADYTPSDVLSRITASQKAVSNATFECVWKDFLDEIKLPDGRTLGRSKWERQTFYWDNLGRRRNILHGGPLPQDGRMLEDEDPSSTDELFNGEIVLHTSSHPKWTHEGLKPASPKDAVGYTAVIIGDAAAPIRSGLESERNPLEYMRNVALSEIAAAIRDGTAAAHSSEDGTVALDIKHAGSDAPYVRTVITVAPKHNWAIESIRSYRSDDKLAREVVCDYKEQADGLWVPIRLRHTHWGDRNQDDKPYFDWSFETTKAKYNDPMFDPHIFEVRLKPDTAVSDTRYGVAYRVGTEGASAGDLDRNAANVPGAKPPSLLGKSLPDLTSLGLKAADLVADQPMVVMLIDAEQRPSRHSLSVLTNQAAALQEKHIAVIVLQAVSGANSDFGSRLEEAAQPFPIANLKDASAIGRFDWGVRSLPWIILTDRSRHVVAEGFPIEELETKLKELVK